MIEQSSGGDSKKTKRQNADGVEEFDDIRHRPSSSSDSEDRRRSIEPNYDTENGQNQHFNRH